MSDAKGVRDRLLASVSTAYAVALDIGVRGAIAGFTESGELLWIRDMPVTREANGRHATNAPLLSGILAPSHARVAYAEFVAARPTDAKVAAFSFGRSRGILEGVCGASSIPIVWIAPAVWKRASSIPPGKENKDLARTRGLAKWPNHAESFAKKSDVDRAEACLIGLCGLERRRMIP